MSLAVKNNIIFLFFFFTFFK